MESQRVESTKRSPPELQGGTIWTWLDDSSCACRHSHGLTQTSCRLLQYATHERHDHCTLRQVAIFAHLKYTQVANWGLGVQHCCSCEAERGEGQEASGRAVGDGGWCGSGVERSHRVALAPHWVAVFLAEALIVFYVREGHICP